MPKAATTSDRQSASSNRNRKAASPSAAELAARHFELWQEVTRLDSEQFSGSRRERATARRDVLVLNDRAELLRTEILAAPIRSTADAVAVAVHGCLRAASLDSGDNALDEMENAIGLTDGSFARLAVFLAQEAGIALEHITREADFVRDGAAEGGR